MNKTVECRIFIDFFSSIIFLGYQYAMFSLKVMLSAILRNFVLSSDLKMSNLELNHGIVLQLQNKHLVTVERRKW